MFIFKKKNNAKNLSEADQEAIEYNKKQEGYDDKLKDKAQKHRFKNALDAIRFPTFTKNLVALIVGVALIDLQLSYVLAFMDKQAIAESLSEKICDTIIAVAFAYIVRAYFDNRQEHRQGKADMLDVVNKMVNTKIAQTFNKATNDSGVFSEEDFKHQEPTEDITTEVIPDEEPIDDSPDFDEFKN